MFLFHFLNIIKIFLIFAIFNFPSYVIIDYAKDRNFRKNYLQYKELSHHKIPEEIVAIYLYGSAIKRKLRADSDIDIAILPSNKINQIKALELISQIESIFTEIFKKFGFLNKVSVLNMKGKYVSIELLFDIIINGLCIYERIKDEHIEFKNYVMREFMDFKPFLDKLRTERYGIVS
ncbi:MAG: nucleotidyltransferase domain-containing protein [Thermodesulfovibrio sp.]|nr:nucleotidyltransferase domain-containing protein [Thermodesulfovibrio sp.]